jgi:hypothetical protein
MRMLLPAVENESRSASRRGTSFGRSQSVLTPPRQVQRGVPAAPSSATTSMPVLSAGRSAPVASTRTTSALRSPSAKVGVACSRGSIPLESGMRPDVGARRGQRGGNARSGHWQPRRVFDLRPVTVREPGRRQSARDVDLVPREVDLHRGPGQLADLCKRAQRAQVAAVGVAETTLAELGTVGGHMGGLQI